MCHVERSQNTLQRCSLGHHRRSTCLFNLSMDLHDRFEQFGSLSDLDEAFEFYEAALELRPPGISYRYATLNNIANSLRDRF
ncbi:hypothetical protein BD769DRAFT_1355449 [Suillus cothurnatus]|nr:hypothetical protein BD769DRAFT_1355449 [Suillus cothurnatus]